MSEHYFKIFFDLAMYREIGEDAAKIKEVIERIKTRINETVQNAQNKLRNFKQDNLKQEKDILDENAALVKSINTMKIEIEDLMNKKAILKEKMELNLEEMKETEKENEEYKQSENSIQMNIKSAERNVERLKEEIENLKIKKANLLNKNEEQERQFLIEMDFYKNIMGVEYKVIKEYVVKLLFKVENKQVWIIFDFSKEDVVVKSEPEINYEYYNEIYKKSPDFYKFLKLLRSECINKL